MPQNHSGWLFARHKFEESRDVVDRAILQTRASLAVAAQNPKFLHLMRLHCWQLAESSLFLRDYNRAGEATDNVVGLGKLKPAHLYMAAKNYVRCASLADIDTSLSPENGDTVKTRFTDQALEFLRRAAEN